MRSLAGGLGRRAIIGCGSAMLLVAATLVTGCAGSDNRPGSASAVGSATRDFGTLVERTPRPDLLTLEEIRPYLVLGFDIREQPMLDPTVLDLRMIHGPCGAEVLTPFSATKGFVVFRSTETLTVEAIAEPGDAAAKTFIDQLAADATTGCPGYTERLGGAPLQVAFDKVTPLAELGTRRFGFEQRLSGGSAYAHRFVMVGAGGGRVTMLVVHSNDPVIAENLNPVLKAAITGT
jgi:hypothetical protein